MNRIGIYCIAAISLGGVGCGSGTMTGTPDMAMKPSPPIYVEAKDKTQTPANYKDCVADPAGPDKETEVEGLIKDFQDDNLVEGAVIKIYKTAADVPANPIAMTTSDKDGKYKIKVPAGAPYRLIYGSEGGKAISNGNPVDTIATYEFNRAWNDKERVAVKVSTREAIPGLVSVIPDVTLGVLAGSVRDCKRSDVGGAQVKITGTGKLKDGTDYKADEFTFYFVEVSGSTLPTRTQKWTAANGTFAALNVPAPGTATVTAYGTIALGGKPVELGKETVPLQPGAITIIEILPKNL
ncbi:MAG: hypothetical protein EXR72_27225 [Myxococcales bacterium]|nr:hypothetical protein [Myxococcales bacterium]